MSLITQLIGLIGIGLLTGSVVGLTGASGVVVVVPLLTVLSGFSMHTAIGTSLFVMSSHLYLSPGPIIKTECEYKIGLMARSWCHYRGSNRFLTRKSISIWRPNGSRVYRDDFHHGHRHVEKINASL